jgi:hypothetical protein
MTPINFDRDLAIAAREGCSEWGRLSWKPRGRSTQLWDVPKESPQKNLFPSSPDSGVEGVAAYLGDLGELSRDP